MSKLILEQSSEHIREKTNKNIAHRLKQEWMSLKTFRKFRQKWKIRMHVRSVMKKLLLWTYLASLLQTAKY